MKKGIHVAFMRTDKKISKIFCLFFCFILSMNLSGQKLHTILGESWGGTAWGNASLQTLTYDVNGFMINSLTQVWDVPTLAFKTLAQSNYTNNVDGTANQVISQSWNVSAWNNSSRLTYTYNASKKVLTTLTEFWFGSVWQNFSELTITYDGSGFLTNRLTQNWDIISSAFKNSSRSNYTNNANGTANQVIDQSWDGVSSWTNSTRVTYTYNAAGKMLTSVSDDWTGTAWLPKTMETNTYNGSNNLIHNLSQKWDSGTSSWINDTQSDYSNNPDGTVSQVVTQTWDGVSAWVNSSRITFSFTPATAVSEPLKESDITIYPNPAYNVITVKANSDLSGSGYTFSDQTGKPVLKGRLTNEITTIDITSLTNGIYFLKIGERSQQTFKVIKQN